MKRFFKTGLLICILALHAVMLCAQQSPAPQASDAVPPNLYHLHVYVNLMQFPTVVFDSNMRLFSDIPRERFDVSLDGGPVFHPTKLRIEGDDPVTLAVLLDASGKEQNLLSSFADSLAALAPIYLHPKDHVTIFAVDCNLIRSADDIPSEPEALRLGVTTALAAAGLHGEKKQPACASTIRLWDALAAVTTSLADKPGRRVILVVSSGNSYGDKNQIRDMSDFAGSKAVAIFGLRDGGRLLGNHGKMPTGRDAAGTFGLQIATSMLQNSPARRDLLQLICQKNGGVVLTIHHSELTDRLRNFLEILRSRYIIEYPRPDIVKAGIHDMDVKVHGAFAIALGTGGSSPLPDPTLAADPSNVPATPSPAQVGGRRRLDQPKPKS
jgi:hypothetical protein